MTAPPWYDTREGLEARLSNLDGLAEIARARQQAWYDRKERMETWVLLGRFVLDTCGNLSVIESGAPAEIYPHVVDDHVEVPRVLTREEAHAFSRRWISHGFSVPTERCDYCGHGWTLANVHECHWVDSQPTPIPRHEKCRRLHVAQHAYEELSRIIERAEIRVCSKHLVPNEYHPDDLYFGPWMLVETPRGRIRIGWRKRVINIDWSESAIRVPESVFMEEQVTKWATGIHAWSEEKAVEYLRKIWAC